MTSSFERDQSHSEVEMYIVGRIQEEFRKNESQDIELHNMSIDYLEKKINSVTNIDTSVGTEDISLIDISDNRDEHHQSSNDFYPDGNSPLRNENMNIDSGAKDVVTVDNLVIKTEPLAVHSGYPGSNINTTEDTSDINFPQGTEKNKLEGICSFITELLHIHDSKIMCLLIMPPRRRVEGHINLPLSVRLFVCPDIDTWFVRLSPPTVLELQL